jgi:hypothetical protein
MTISWSLYLLKPEVYPTSLNLNQCLAHRASNPLIHTSSHQLFVFFQTCKQLNSFGEMEFEQLHFLIWKAFFKKELSYSFFGFRQKGGPDSNSLIKKTVQLVFRFELCWCDFITYFCRMNGGIEHKKGFVRYHSHIAHRSKKSPRTHGISCMFLTKRILVQYL